MAEKWIESESPDVIAVGGFKDQINDIKKVATAYLSMVLGETTVKAGENIVQSCILKSDSL